METPINGFFSIYWKEIDIKKQNLVPIVSQASAGSTSGFSFWPYSVTPKRLTLPGIEPNQCIIMYADDTSILSLIAYITFYIQRYYKVKQLINYHDGLLRKMNDWFAYNDQNLNARKTSFPHF